MGNINDFKIVKQRAKKYAQYLNLNEDLFVKNGSRFGFYLLILECITNVKEYEDLVEMIIDTDFRKQIFKQENNDLGIDAVNINKDEKIIQLFNFKYRDNFNKGKQQKLSDMVNSVKFLLPVESENFNNLDELTKLKVEKIVECLNSDDVWKMELYMVSNDNIPLALEDPIIDNFKENYGLEVETIVLDDVVSYLSETPKDLKAKFILDSESVMTYEVDTLSTSKSYLIRLPIAELIRITCSDKELRINPIEDYSKLKKQKLELSLLYDNVRGYLGDTKFNGNIINTIKENPNMFFMYNNGLTITTKEIKAKFENGKKKFVCEIDGYQIVNGGQTLRSIYKYCNNEFDEENLANAEILLRIFQTESDRNLTNAIAEYTNSQNAISSIDLKSVNSFQIQLESFLKGHSILYVRKSGDVGDSTIDYKERISMEKVAQIIYANMGHPDRATNQKRALFEKYYDDIFDEDNLDFDNVLSLINLYYEIEETYKLIDREGFHQKYLYVIFILNKLNDNNVKNAILLLERLVSEYKQGEKLSVARKLIQKGCKDFVAQSIENGSL